MKNLDGGVMHWMDYHNFLLSKAIRENYDNPQKEEYVEKYSHIVQFRDGKNTERLIDFLKEDKLI